MTLLVFMPLVAVLVLSHVARIHLTRLRERSRAATARVTGSIGEIFEAVQAIQVAGAEERVVARLRRAGDERRRAMLRDRLLGLALDAVFTGTASLGTGLTLLVAASAMRSGAFTVGDFALFATYVMRVADMTGFLGWIVTTYQQMGVAFGRGVALLHEAPAGRLIEHHESEPARPLPPLLPPARAERDRLETPEVVVLCGRIGSGKTTLLRAILGLLPAESGVIRWNGRPVADPQGFFVPPRAACTPQVSSLLSGTLRENVLLGLPDGERLERAVRDAVLERDLAAFPAGLDTVVGARGVKLSGGQVRTVAARMLVRDAELLVSDDLSSVLDAETEHLLWQRLFERRDVTCLVVSHRPRVLERAELILVLEDGRITARGRLDELLRTSEEIRWLYSGDVFPEWDVRADEATP